MPSLSMPSGSARRLSALALSAALACASGAVSSPPPPPPPAPPPPPPVWVQVWSDEFDGPAAAGVDTTKWTYDLGDGCPGVCGWGNNEKEYYRSDSANIRRNGLGQLEIVARVSPAADSLHCYYGLCRYTSAKITTRGKMSVTWGRLDARIKLAAGQGLWPAFWLLGNNIGVVGWPTCGEMDIMENKGSQNTMTSSAVHGPGYSGNTPFAHVYQPVTTTDFHVYSVEWNSTSIRFFVDSVQHYEVARANVTTHGNWVFDSPFYAILNLAVGGNFDHDPASDAIFPATMLVDYVRVYTKQ